MLLCHSFVVQEYILIAESCWSREVADRPTMDNVLKALEALMDLLMAT